jgi:hypothetical protein
MGRGRRRCVAPVRGRGQRIREAPAWHARDGLPHAHGRRERPQLGIALFDTEEDLRTGDEALSAMSPSTSDVGTRVSVEIYEVGAEIRA